MAELNIVEKVIALEAVELLQNLTPEQLARIASIAKEVKFPPGKVILDPKQPQDALYVIVSGRMDVNARGVFLANQIACRHFLAGGTKGVIVNTASLAGKVGAPLLAHYSASKFAVLGWTQALAREMAPAGIRVNAVCPGFVKTSMQEREVAWESELRGMTPEAIRAEYVSLTPLGRIEEPEDVARVVLFLASDASGFMTGQGINVTGGVRMD